MFPQLRSRIAVTSKPSNLWFGAQIAPYFAASPVTEPNFQFGGHRQVQLDGLRAAGSSNIGALKIPRSQWVQAVADCATIVRLIGVTQAIKYATIKRTITVARLMPKT
jgi:hypothetical protein